MSIELNHTIVHARDPLVSATFLAEMLGRPAPVRFGPFWDVELDNHVTLAYIVADEHLTWGQFAGLPVVLLGCWLAAGRRTDDGPILIPEP